MGARRVYRGEYEQRLDERAAPADHTDCMDCAEARLVGNGKKYGDRIDCVECVEGINCFDCPDLPDSIDSDGGTETRRVAEKEGSAKGLPGSKRKRKGPESGSRSFRTTEGEDQDTQAEHPELRGALSSSSAEWTEEELVRKAIQLVQVKASTKDAIESLYGDFEDSPATLLGLPHHLVPSSTMSGLPYPLSGKLAGCVTRLKELSRRHQDLVCIINKESVQIVRTCYMLFRLFRKGLSTYYHRKSPVQHLFATSYQDSAGYPRLIPRSEKGSATIANSKRECKRVIKEVFNTVLLPQGLVLEEMDMVACHTGIYAGLMGEAKAPYTWEAYRSGSFWSHILSRWGEDIPKNLLKTLLYSGGASLRK